MLASLYIASSGLSAHQSHVDSIANNISNINTVAYKRSRVEFEDLVYTSSPINNVGNSDDQTVVRGAGAAIGENEKMFSLGSLKQTGGYLDLAINGNGFFEISLPNGSVAYTRSGTLRLDKEGFIVNHDGYPLNPLVQVPVDAEAIVVSPNGSVFATFRDEAEPVEIGKIEVASFVNVSGLTPIGNNLYQATNESGDAMYAVPGENGTGELIQGYVESSNVDLVVELTGLMLAQRAYQLNARVAQAADEMLSIVNSLRR